MEKKISILLILCFILSLTESLNISNINAVSNLNSLKQNETVEESVYESVYQPNPNNWGVFSLEQIDRIKIEFSSEMKKVAAFYYSELVPLLDEGELIAMLDWQGDELYPIISAFPLDAIELLRELTPIVMSSYDYQKNPDQYIMKMNIKNEQQMESLKSPIDSTYYNVNKTNTSVNKSTYGLQSTMNSSIASAPLGFSEKSNPFHYEVNTDSLVDPIYKTSNQNDLDLILPGRNGLDFIIKRSYSSLNAKIMTPFYNGNLGCYEGNSDYALYNAASDCLGNWPYPSHYDVDQDPNFIATGWSLNLPQMSKGSINHFSTNETINKGFYNRTPLGSSSDTPYIRFSLDDGSSYEFRKNGANYTLYNHPYSNVTYTEQDGNYHLTVDAKITYVFNSLGKILSKRNFLGDQITYQHQSEKVIVTDSVNRTIEILRENNHISGFIAKDELGRITNQISYMVTFFNRTSVFRSYIPSSIDQYAMQEINASYLQLDSVKDILKNHIFKTYTYYQLDLSRHADYNFEDDYYYNLSSNREPILDYLNAESSTIVSRNAQTYGEIEYLLLNEVSDDTGFTIQFKYRSYSYSWNNTINGEYMRGTTRLFLDPYNISYVGYHPVDVVYYKYFNQAGETKLLHQQFSNFSTGFQEVWNRPKLGWTIGDNRLNKSNDELRPDVNGIFIYTFMGDYSETDIKFFQPINNGQYVTTMDSTNSGRLDNSISEIVEGKQYKYVPQAVQSYQYDVGKTKPYLTKGFSAEVNVINRPDIRDFLWSGNTRTLPIGIENFGTIYRTEYNNDGYVIYQEDSVGNKIEISYDGPYKQISYQKQTSTDGKTKNETTYAYNNDGTTSSITNKGSYRDMINPAVERTDTVITEYSGYTTFKKPTHIKTISSGHQFGTQPIETNVDMMYDSKGLNVEKETVYVTLIKNQAPQALDNLYEYNERNLLKKQTFPDGSYVDYLYDYKNRLEKETYTSSQATNRVTRTTSYSYNDAQRLVTQTMPDGEELLTYYTPYGEIDTQKRKKGLVTRTILVKKTNSGGKLVKSVQPFGDVGQEEKYIYGENGQLQTVVNPIGQRTQYFYANVMEKVDGSAKLLQNTTRVIAPDSSETWTYADKEGRVTKEVQKSSNKIRNTEYTHTSLGQVTQKKVSVGNEFQLTNYGYDASGNLTYLKDNENNTNQYVYNRLGQLIATYTNGQLGKQKEYNQVGWLLSNTDPGNKVKTYEYTNTGLLDTFTDLMLQKHKYYYTSFDELERLSIRNNSGTEIYWEKHNYYPLTRLISSNETSEGEKINYNYDDWKRLDVQTVKNRDYKLSYDNFDRLQYLTYPDNKVVTYVYDVINRIDTVTYPDMGTVDYNYETNVNEYKNTLIYPNGITQERKANSFGEITSYKQISLNNNSNWNETFQSDAFSNIKGIKRNGSDFAYTFDGLNRIKNEVMPTGTKTYTYDGKGNRETVEGEMAPIDIETESFTYNAKNMLKTYSSGSTNASYTYYGDGLRATKTVNNELTRYVNLGGHIIEELDKDGNVRARNIWGNEMLYRLDLVSNKKGYYSYNGHGDVVKITDNSGIPIKTYDYDIWGNLLSETGDMSNPFMYTGEVYDKESGLYYLRARYYNPIIGRFINEDTYEGEIENPLSLNLYTYVANNPLIYIDPSGNCFTKALGKKYCEAVWNAVKKEAKAQVEFMKDVHSSWYSAVDYWSMGTLTQLNEYYKISQENPYSFEQFLSAGYIMLEITPSGKTAKFTDKGLDFINAVRKGCNCFTAGTKVLTDEGEKNIEDIEVGDMVLAKDENNPEGEKAYKEVTNLYRNQHDDIIKLYVGEQVIETTDNHPFWVEGKGWLFADELQVGDKLQKADGSNLAIDKVEFVKLDEPVTVYNFAVADFHTYYVTNLGIWVHNTNNEGCLFGANGVQTTSKTIWKQNGSKARIDVENPSPGQRAGQIHYQDANNKKYLYDPDKKAFVDKNGDLAPKSVNDMLKDPNFVKKLNVGLTQYLGESPYIR